MSTFHGQPAVPLVVPLAELSCHGSAVTVPLTCLLQVVSPPEVSFQRDCSPAEVRSLIRSCMDGADKKLEAMAVRSHKHLGSGPLFRAAWDCIKQQLISR
jgi:hypothetical protein